MSIKVGFVSIKSTELSIKNAVLGKTVVLESMEDCYKTLKALDRELLASTGDSFSELVELANLSSMIGNILGASIMKRSEGKFLRNKPNAYPDLLNKSKGKEGIEIKIALENNSPKGHHAKAGNYITFRYVLVNADGTFTPGVENRGKVVKFWEVRAGYLTEDDFNLSNTSGDSGKTATIKSSSLQKMGLVFFDEKYSPKKSI